MFENNEYRMRPANDGKFCYFCDRVTYRSTIKALSPDPDCPEFVVCDLRSCTKSRARMPTPERKAKYEARRTKLEADEAEWVLIEQKRLREEAREQRADELKRVRIQRLGAEPVQFSERLASGWVCPCKDHKVAKATRAEAKDAASIEALSDSDLDGLAEQYRKRNAERTLMHLRVDLALREHPRFSHVARSVCGVHIGKLSLGHAEVRRQVAKRCDTAWVEMDLPNDGGIQSWFLVGWAEDDKLLDAVALADTQPIPAHRCDACGKDAGLDYTSINDDPGIHHQDQQFIVCSRSECRAKRKRAYDRNWRAFVSDMVTRRAKNNSMKPPTMYPAPGPLESSD